MNQDKYNKKDLNPQNQLNASRHLLELVNSYVDDEQVRADVVESYQAKKPKSYAQVFNGLFRFSKVTLFAFHSLSFLIATPLVFSLAFQFILRRDQHEIKGLFDSIVQDMSNMFTPLFIIPAAITLMILLLLEYGQHVTLNSLFNIFFQWKKQIVPGLFVLALLFSIASVGTSGLGAKEFVQVSKAPDSEYIADIDRQINDALELRKKHSDRGNSTIRQRDAEVEYLRAQKQTYLSENKDSSKNYGQIMMAISLFFEIMIIANTFNIHNYQFKTTKETQMINDLKKGHGDISYNPYYRANGNGQQQSQHNNQQRHQQNGQYNNQQNGQYYNEQQQQSQPKNGTYKNGNKGGKKLNGHPV